MKWLGKIFSSGAGSFIKEAGDLIDKSFTNEKERQEQKRLLIKTYLEDKASARAMYENDSSLQKIFAIVFLLGYLFITSVIIWMIYQFAQGVEIPMPEWGIAFVNMIFGAMSSKVNTITDFLFGSSQGSQMKNVLHKKDK